MSDSAPAIDGLVRHWDFVPTPLSPLRRLYRMRALLQRPVAPPRQLCLKPVTPRARWMVYFAYCPDGVLTPAHRFTLARLRALKLALLVVFASREPSQLPPELAPLCDGLYWKALPGYDFSAYTLALTEIAARSPGADVMLLNDSVLGPFADLDALMTRAPWQLSGLTANWQLQNHIQSYAFILRGLTPEVLRALRPVFFRRVALNAGHDVVLCQETRLARVAARSMSVGAFWYSGNISLPDPALMRPLQLLDAGFPFLKRSLLGKCSHLIARDAVLAAIGRFGHPLDFPPGAGPG